MVAYDHREYPIGSTPRLYPRPHPLLNLHQQRSSVTSCSNPWGGGHTRIFREGYIIVALVAQNQKSDCMEMLGNMINTGDRVVGVSWKIKSNVFI
jgi:hypothetical protein